MRIDVFGPGCAKCLRSADVAQGFLAAHSLVGEVVKHTSIEEMAERGILRTPTILVDGELVVEGRILRDSDLEAWMKQHGDLGGG